MAAKRPSQGKNEYKRGARSTVAQQKVRVNAAPRVNNGSKRRAT